MPTKRGRLGKDKKGKRKEKKPRASDFFEIVFFFDVSQMNGCSSKKEKSEKGKKKEREKEKEENK